MKQKYLVLGMAFLLMMSTQSVFSKIKLPAIISSNMVLQRNTTVVLWGWANANEEITIETSWLETSLKTIADNQGNWQVGIQTTGSKEAQYINIKSSGVHIQLENILFGEVWLCSGQSNMQQSLKGYSGQPTFGGNVAVAKASNPNLRLLTVNREASKTPLKELGSHIPWQEASPENAADFSAISYFFGQKLQEVLDVPVGVVHSSWGGSKIESWISRETMEMFQPVNLDNVDISNNRARHIPTALFNAMIHPLIPYTIRGVLWYQGESNMLAPDSYKKLFPAMVKDWRTRWGGDDFPFYYVQIAPYIYGGNEKYETVQNSAFMRESQLQCLDLIPNSGMVVTMDIGEEFCIHPAQKEQVADRLLYIALNQTYGFTEVNSSGPVFNKKEQKDGGILLEFKHANNGLFAFDQLEGFEVAGDDKVFHHAEVDITDNGRALFVKSDKVPRPVAVRYAWDNWIKGTLFNTSLLPASSFRTDNWPDAIRFK